LSRTRYFALTTCAYLLLNLPIALLLGASFTDWLPVPFICLVSLVIFARLERKRAVQPDELQQLTRFLTLEKEAWTLLEKQWLGRTVWLKEDILNLREPEGMQLYVQAGTPGIIVALNRDKYAPFTVKFSDFPHKVKVRFDKLGVPLDDDSAGNVPAKRRASLWKRLTSRRPLLPTTRLVYDEDDDVPEDAEAFVDEMRHFAAFDWHVWNDRYARRAYRQMKHWDN